MHDLERSTRTIETQIQRLQMGESYLEVHTKYAYGEKVMEAFTLESLAAVMGWPMSTMEGRYARAKLQRWKVDVQNGSGRPKRGFPLALLEDVIALLRTRGAVVQATPNYDTVNKPIHRGQAALVPTYHMGKPYYTISALADHFGFSGNTIRNKLRAYGLHKRLVNLTVGAAGGRPAKAMPESMLEDVRRAIVDGVSFASELDRILANAGHDRKAGLEQMKSNIVPHTPPTGLRAWDRETLAPVVPRIEPHAKQVNAVNRPGLSAAEIEDLTAQIEQMMTPVALSPDVPVVAPAPDHTSEAPDPDVSRQMWDMHVEALAAEVGEPTAGEIRETVEMLALDKAGGERFAAEVMARRAQRK